VRQSCAAYAGYSHQGTILDRSWRGCAGEAFFLDILIGSRVLEDTDGQDFPDLDAAITEAVASARDLVAYGIMQNKDLSARSFLIRDGKDETVATVPFRDALPGRLRGWPLPGSMGSTQPYVTANLN
jgi:hypothetical protein